MTIKIETTCCENYITFQQISGGGASWWYVMCTKCGCIYLSVHEKDTVEMARCRRMYRRYRGNVSQS